MNSERHLGHLIVDCFRSRPNAICQIDAGTGESETKGSVLSRSIRLALSLRKYGLRPGDVVALCGRNHLDICIPYYAALFNGLPLIGIDFFYKLDEVKSLLDLSKPKIAFCDTEYYDVYAQAVQELGMDIKIVSLRGKDSGLEKFIEQYQSEEKDESFQVAAVDLDKYFIWLISTSGSTGKCKINAFTHRVWLNKTCELINPRKYENDSNIPALNLSPIHWISALYNLVSMPLTGQIVVQTSLPYDPGHVVDIINKYKPVFLMTNPSSLNYLLKHEKHADFTCFKNIIIGGGIAPDELVIEVKERAGKNALVRVLYGQTETLGRILGPHSDTPLGSCGRPLSNISVKLVDPDTEAEITEPYKTGELWSLCPRFTCYYNNPEETAKAFSKDGWYKTGDLMYRNENNDYFFVERLKRLIKYQNYNIIPSEIEDLIRSYPGVVDVALSSVPHENDGEYAVACVIKQPGSNVSAREIIDLVANKLSEKKQLRGGVVFVDDFPALSNGKISYVKLKEIALAGPREY